MKSSPSKAMFYTMKKDLENDVVEKIMADQQAKREIKMNDFLSFVDSIERKESAESIIKKKLNI